MEILGIDTSCDDTAVAIIKIKGRKNPQFKILANVISSQIKVHKKYGGVYPSLAKREHQRNLIPVLKEALLKAELLSKTQNTKHKTQNYNLKLKIIDEILKKDLQLGKRLKKFLNDYEKPEIDLIAVTVGPGLEPCLWQGVNFARALSFFWKIPIIAVNHIEAHIFANFIGSNLKQRLENKNLFPAICLIVSGGHTQLILMKGIGKYKILGETRDDAAGECFDKTARILGLGYPGGPAIANIANQYKPPFTDIRKSKFVKISDIKLPRPMLYSKDYDFSFSGLKTAVLYKTKSEKQKAKNNKEFTRAMAKEIQQAIIDVLLKKTIRAARDYRVKTIILGGGVAANKELRRQLKEKLQKELSGIQYLIPDIQLSTDNAAMVAVAGYYNWQKDKIKKWSDIKANANLRL